MAKANRFAKNDEGVSAVIGVILMVAITVILAAVIAAFVFGMVGNVNQKKSPAFTVKRINNTAVQITLQDKGGATTIKDFIVTQPSITSDHTASFPSNTTNIGIGETATINDSNISGTVHIVATASVDGNTQVVIDTNV